MDAKDQAPSSHPAASNEQVDDSNANDDEIFEELEREIEDDFDMVAFREQRLEELKRE